MQRISKKGFWNESPAFYGMKSDTCFLGPWFMVTWHALSAEHGFCRAEWKSMFIVFPRGFEHLCFGRLEELPLAGAGGLQHCRDMLQEGDQLLGRRFVWFTAIFHLGSGVNSHCWASIKLIWQGSKANQTKISRPQLLLFWKRPNFYFFKTCPSAKDTQRTLESGSLWSRESK